MDVIKRDGRKVPFVKDKIVATMMSAFSRAEENASPADIAQFEYFAIGVSDRIYQFFESENKTPTVEAIQDLAVLMLTDSVLYKGIVKFFLEVVDDNDTVFNGLSKV